MAEANWQSDQPTNLNYLSPVNFDLLVEKLQYFFQFFLVISYPCKYKTTVFFLFFWSNK